MKSYKELLGNDPLAEAIQSVVEGKIKTIDTHKTKRGDVTYKLEKNSKGKLEIHKSGKGYEQRHYTGSDSEVKSKWKEIMKEDNTNDKSDDGEGLDKVQPKAVKKKFKGRKDKDIDNDGDVDDSDEFLHKRRKAISKSIAKEDVDKADETPAGDDTEDEAPKKKKKKKDGEKDTPTTKDTGEEPVDVDPKLDESKDDDEPMDDDERKKIVSTFFKGLKKEDYAKYGKRAEAVMQKVAEKLADK